jgi:hypothetical protein
MSWIKNNINAIEYVICVLTLLTISLSFFLDFMMAQAFQYPSIYFNNIIWYLRWIVIFVLALKSFKRVLFWLVIITSPWILPIDLTSLSGVPTVPDFLNFIFINGLVAFLDLIVIACVIVNFFIKKKTLQII